MKKWRKICAVLLLTALTAGCSQPGITAVDESATPSRLILTALNIGKADCLLLQWDGQAFLIDAGYAQNAPLVAAMLAHYNVTRLNGVFLTHCHMDHYGGLSALAKSGIAVDAWYTAALYHDVETGQHPAALAAAIRAETPVYLKAGDVISAGDAGSFTVLGPIGVNEDNENNNSLVLRFACPAGSALLAGDMKEDEEYDLLHVNAFTPCDVLKVGHHGDGGATTLAMLRAVQPKAAIISTSSKEEYDTPSWNTVSRLSAAGAQIYVTEKARDAWELTLEDGRITAEDIRLSNVPEKVDQLSLSIDLSNDLLTIRCSGGPVSLAGCVVYSTKGNEMLTLPDVTLQNGQSYTIGSKATGGNCDFVWPVKRVWNKKKLDVGILYDSFGRPIACTDNGLSE